MDALTQRTCPHCQGTGSYTDPGDCPRCNGSGVVDSRVIRDYPPQRESPDVMQPVIDAALHVVQNVYRQRTAHARGPDGNCCADCIPCWVSKLWAALARTEAGQAHFLATASLPNRKD